jgi:hypothetical protein
MALFSIIDLKNRITTRFNANKARVITGVDLQETFHDVIDSLLGNAGQVDPGVLAEEISDYGLTGTIDEVNRFFSTSHEYLPGTLKLYLNGVRQFLGQDYTEEGSGVICFLTAPFTGDKIIADYKY